MIKKILEAVEARIESLADSVSKELTELQTSLVKYIDEKLKELPAGEPGKDGADGVDGRDALDLEVLPDIDDEKSYPRGTWAKYKGGLWRSYEKTHGLRGWECIVNGIDCIELNLEGKTFKAVCILSDGTQNEMTETVPVITDKGVFKGGHEYKAGDAVTWGGSLWIAQLDDPQGRPGASKSEGWRLAVKRGRDGKDGTDGKDLTKGVKL